MTSLTSLHRPVWLEIDLDAVAHNLAAARRLVGPSRKLFAVIKGDGYGFGSAEVADVFATSGADALALADLGDAIRLRKCGIRHPILLYPNALPEVAGEVLAFDIIPTLVDEDGARAFSAAASAPFSAFVKVDVGLERLGVPAESVAELVRRIVKLPRLHIEGIYTHLHASGAVERDYIDWQLARFSGAVEELDAENIRIPVRMVASSTAVVRFPHTYFNAVDPGRILYGFAANGGAPAPAYLRPVFRGLKTRLIALKPVTARARFVEQAPFPLAATSRVGVIPVGWGDGLGSLHAGRVLIRGRSVGILGRPSFEHTRIDLTSVPEAQVGDEVVLIGRQGDVDITLGEIARYHDLDPIQLAPGVGWRVARAYYSKDLMIRLRTP